MAKVLTGSDILATRGFADMTDKKIGFVGNHTSRLSTGVPTHVEMSRAKHVELVKLFSPEHGAFGMEDCEGIADDVDPVTRLPIFSLYGEIRKPTSEMLDGLDMLVFELQDVGARFYTYASTMLLCMEAANDAGIEFVVLDRPNPISLARVEGPIADAGLLSFTACHAIPIRHGLTMGELARLAAAERGFGIAPRVVACEGLTESMWWDDTGLPWTSPSPAMATLDTATVYPGVCLLEQANVSVGRGTESPFQLAGAPWIDAAGWADAIGRVAGGGIDIRPVEFRPAASKFAHETCHGVELIVTDRDALESVRLGIAMIVGLRDIHGGQFDLAGVGTLLAGGQTMRLIETGCTTGRIVDGWTHDLAAWDDRVRPNRLYDRKAGGSA
jgi:uncharacterized protein YbbC (DUF1343 family)